MNDEEPVDAMQSMTMSPKEVVDSINICINDGSVYLEPLQGMVPLISWESFMTKLYRTSSVETSILRVFGSSIGCKKKAGSEAPVKVLTMSQMQNWSV
jgi:hypothetical protein